MKTRIISGVIATALLVVLLVFGMQYPIILDIAFVLACALAVWEVLDGTKLVKRRVITILAMAFSALTVLSYSGLLGIPALYIQVVFAVVLLWLSLLLHKSMQITEAIIAVALTMILSFAFSSLLLLITAGGNTGLMYFILVCCFAWGSDIGAYFTGVFFGKHKLCPAISPKKTVEGAVGGIVFAVALSTLTAGLFNRFGGLDVAIWLVACVAPVFSVAGMFGDLTASMIKRQCNIKDYGKIMPGHGGILDRFDSILMISPLFYLLTQLTMHI